MLCNIPGIFNHDSTQDLNLGPAECGTVLTTVPLCSVSFIGLFCKCFIQGDYKVSKSEFLDNRHMKVVRLCQPYAPAVFIC